MNILKFIFLIAFIIYLVAFIILKITNREKERQKNIFILMIIWLVLTVVMFYTSSTDSVNNQENDLDPSSEIVTKNQYLDEIIQSVTLGNQTMSYNDYQSLVIGKATFEGLLAKYGAPSHATNLSEGDDYLQVTFPTTDEGYSSDLTFKFEERSFGNWVLDTKNVVETDGISFSKYKAQ